MWADIISETEQQKQHVSWKMVQAINVHGYNGTELALDLWSFASRHLGKGLDGRRKK